jgi:ferritin-like metal-binding protein YciE
MEQTVLDMLGQLETAAQRAELKEQLRHHATETEQQVRNLEQAFQAVGAESTTSRARRSRASRRRARR